jgi:hypothetical protein
VAAEQFDDFDSFPNLVTMFLRARGIAVTHRFYGQSMMVHGNP